MKHFFAILLASISVGYRGKTVDFEKYSNCYRTTVAHFLNNGAWNDGDLRDIIRTSVTAIIYGEALRTGCPVFCIIDDTLSSKTKPSSQALHPMDDAYFHHSHLKKRQDYGHQAVAIMLSCNHITLNYDFIMYDKSKAKIQLALDVTDILPLPPTISYMLCDSWYTCPKIINAFEKIGYYAIAAIKTNRIIYPCGIRQQISEFAQFMEETDADVRLVTVNTRQYYVYRYEGGTGWDRERSGTDHLPERCIPP